MATATSPEAEASEIRRRGRRRLLGAVTLVMALVVFVPMILDNEPRPSRSEPSPVIPPKDNAPPLPAPAPAPVAAIVAEAPKAPVSTSGEVSEPPKPAPAKAEPPKAPEKPAPAAAQKPKLEGFAVQVGAFRDEERLKQARAKLEAAGLAHYTERIDGSGGAMTRLRAGPFPTREAAEAARAKLNDGKVVPLP
jgi:DedD protein